MGWIGYLGFMFLPLLKHCFCLSLSLLPPFCLSSLAVLCRPAALCSREGLRDVRKATAVLWLERKNGDCEVSKTHISFLFKPPFPSHLCRCVCVCAVYVFKCRFIDGAAPVRRIYATSVVWSSEEPVLLR